ncbi:hypothetical protein F2Q69_00020336 [Brassica cretica]|uniref:F-box domain-containing protein n=1 Tax=Brassica cretica TaxID=69181 RepID=A0A8S9Q4N1_BRACR|nr:hypothetical protein F2Q69_00020336 [Brassica cretica]
MDAFDAIPNHVVIDILNKVADVKTLIRCRSVSKRFNSLAAQSDSLLLQLDQIFAAAESEPEVNSPVASFFRSIFKSILPRFDEYIRHLFLAARVHLDGAVRLCFRVALFSMATVAFHRDSRLSLVDASIEANDGNPVDRLQLIKEAHTNKKTGQIQDAVIRSVVGLVETQKEDLLSSQSLSYDGDSTGASTNMFRLQINEMAVPKRKGGRLVGLARRASSNLASSSQVLYTDPMILEQLQNKDERIVALEEQNATILSQNATILAQLESQKETNAEILEKARSFVALGFLVFYEL